MQYEADLKLHCIALLNNTITRMWLFEASCSFLDTTQSHIHEFALNVFILHKFVKFFISFELRSWQNDFMSLRVSERHVSLQIMAAFMVSWLQMYYPGTIGATHSMGASVFSYIRIV